MLARFLAVLMVSAGLVTAGGGGEKSQDIKGWGKAVDPDGDCKLKAADNGKLTVTIPGGYHDLWPEGKVNGPRVTQAVEGDFVVEVRVSGVIVPDQDTALEGKRSSFRSGTLLIWKDAKNFVRLDRGGMVKDKKIYSTAYFHVFKDGKRVLERSEIMEDQAMTLHLERRGKKVTAWAQQGKKTQKFADQTVDLPDQVEVGIGAINASKQDLRVEFDEFKVTRKGK